MHNVRLTQSLLKRPPGEIRSSGPMLRRCALLILVFLVSLVATWPVPAPASDIEGLAFVQDDGTLRMGRHTVRLYGIYIPETPLQCRTFERPVRCGPHALLALEFKSRGFVHCERKTLNPDGSVTALCRVGTEKLTEGDDLAAYLLKRGWAVALPDAPVEYQTMEKVAQYRRLGIWGFSVVPLIR